jgi:crotonobetainyl-CoA:carnitine CoA-transferase CaiB-like acyl-CoA transferase
MAEFRALRQKSWNPGASGPLAGVRIIDLSRVAAGNMLSMQLADFGADVIKFEPLTGDTLRAMKIEGVETYWKVYSRNKRSVAIDFRRPECLDLIRRMVAEADALLENFRPGVLEEMGLGPEVLHEINPKLVIGRISGWGHSGPYRHKPGFGTLAEGYSGYAAISGFGDREPLLPAIFLADMTTGLHGAYSLMVALWHVRVNGGEGQVIELSLLDSMISILGPLAANHKLTGKDKPRTGSRSTTNCPRNVYQTSDGKWMALSASTQRTAARLFRVIGREDMIADPRFDSNSARLRNVEEVDRIVGGFIRSRTLAENLEIFDREEITVGPVYDSSDLVHDDYIIEREALAEYEDPEVGFIPMHAVTARMSATPGAMRRPAPAVGEHTREILEPLVGADAYRELLASGALVEQRPRDPGSN